jgi:AcrR family transcriptional regulator
MSTGSKRKYVSAQRSEAAEATKARILGAARALFTRRGIDIVTIAEIAARADVAVSTVYTLYASKAGILRSIFEGALFGERFQAARERLAGVSDPIELIELSAGVARAIYESESKELGLLRGASAFSPELRKLEKEFEAIRLEMQKPRIELLFAEGRARKGLDIARAERILWMYTSRDVYRMLVHEAGWSPDEFEAWLARTLIEALVEPGAERQSPRSSC